MRIYQDCYQLVSEVFRDLLEMGIKVHPHSMQNKVVKDDQNFSTLEITNYDYCLLSLDKVENLFLMDPTAKNWADQEFWERMDPTMDNPGKAYKLRPQIWDQFLNDKGEFDYTYSDRFNHNESIDKVVMELTSNPDSRQAILSIWDRQIDINGLGGKFRIPCSMYYQILIRENKLHVIYSQRSADAVIHFGNDIYLAWQLGRYLTRLIGTEILGLTQGYLYHNIGSLHVYNKDLKTLETCIQNLGQ